MGSILAAPSHRGSIDYGAGPQSPGVTYPAYATATQSMHAPAMHAALPPTVNSSQYTHYEYDFNDFNDLDAAFSPEQYGTDYDVTSPQPFDSISSPTLPPPIVGSSHTNPETSLSTPEFTPNPFAFPPMGVGAIPPFGQNGQYPTHPYHNMPSSPPYYQQPWQASAPPSSPPVYRQ